ncbi:MAG: TlpA family protein disulfide reductase [Acidimicrobiia bacterium]|nr:TlpA family protein disulfide reductase [Acidimicrobiia bacterium]
MADTKTSRKRDRSTASTTVANPDSGSNKMFTLVIIAILVLGLAGIAIVATSREGVDLDGDQTAPIEIEGEFLTQMTSSGISADPSTDPVIGVQMPTVTGTDFSDNEIVIGADGRAKAVYFLAHWCPHCQAELPRIVELIETGRQPADLDIYAISTSVDASRGGAYPPVRWFDQEGFTAPVIRDSADNEAFLHFGGGGYPYAIYVDADNNIVARSSGELQPQAIEAMWLTAAGSAAAG